MNEPQPGEITQLLKSEKLEKMMPLVYNELRRLADSIFRRERIGHTLQPTALVNEAYLRLAESGGKIEWQNRAHFFGIAARLMRQILVNHALAKNAEKRGGGKTLVSLDEARSESKLNSIEILELHDTLEKLAALDAEQARIVELRFFGGLTLEETAEYLNIPLMRVRREWNMAKLWLYKMLDDSKN
jgi:RNA polymerase sigma factor (TIGR02999 family)